MAALGIAVATVLTPVFSDAQLFMLTKEQMVTYTAQNPFDRFADGRPKVPDALIERARGLSAEEVFAVLPGQGFRNQYADGFRVLHPEKKLVGRAFTVQFMPLRPDLDGVVNANAKAAGIPRMYNQVAIDMLQPGDVLVVDLFGQAEGGHHRRRQPVLLHHEGDEGRRAGGGRLDPRSGRHLADGHAGVFPPRSSQRDQQRDHQRHQHPRAHRQRDGDAGRSRVRRFRRASTSFRRRWCSASSTTPTKSTSTTSGRG